MNRELALKIVLALVGLLGSLRYLVEFRNSLHPIPLTVTIASAAATIHRSRASLRNVVTGRLTC